MEPSHSISNQQPLRRCGNFFLHWLSLLLPEQLRFDAQVMIQQTNVSDLKNSSVSKFFTQLTHLLPALADRAAAALKNLISTREVNGRLLVGLALVGIITPLADIFYTWLPAGRVPESEWYYESYYWLFLCLGPYIAMLSFSIGAMFILLPKASDRRSYFFIVPIGFALAKISWLWQVTTHDEYLRVPPFAYYMYSFGFVAFILLISNYLAWRKYHRADSYERRMDTISTAHKFKLLDSQTIADQFSVTWNEMKAKNY